MKKYIRSIKLRNFLLALLFFNISVGIMFANYLPAIVCNAIRIPLVIYMLMFVSAKTSEIKNSFAKIMLAFLFVYTIFIIFHNFGETLSRFGWHFVDCQGLIVMLFLIIVPAFASLKHLPYILKYSMLGVFIYAVLFIIKIPQVISLFLSGEIVGAQTVFEGLHTYIGGGLIFLILFQDFFSRKKKKLINITAVGTILVAAILGRRGILLIYIIVYALFLILHIKNNVKHRILAILIVVLITYAIIIGIMSVGEQYFPFLFQRFADDTRTMTQDELLYDLGKSGDLLLGRGLAGSYNATSLEDRFRTGIETGYLNMVLKGGWIYVILYTLFITPAVLLGLFQSRNKIVNTMSIYTIAWLFYFNAASSNMSTSIRYFFFLYCIFICYNSKYRNMNDDQILKELDLKGLL